MSLEWFIVNLLADCLLPPMNGILLAGTGWLALRRRPRLARLLIGAGLILLWLQAMPVIGNRLLQTLEGDPLDLAQAQQAQAIVVLGAGRHREAPEYGGDTAGEATLARLRYAAKLHRETGLPLLVTGGKPDGGALSEAETMRRVLVEEFGVPVRWMEGVSINTRENTRLSAELLKRDGITQVLLVTHAWHMPRATRTFTASGLAVLPAPTSFQQPSIAPLDFVPQAGGLMSSRLALHEWIGMLWYRLRA